MADNVRGSQTDGPAKRGTAPGADAVSGATARRVDPALLGTAFPRTYCTLALEFGSREDFDDPRREWRRLRAGQLGDEEDGSTTAPDAPVSLY
jgi:hypothetical protein